MSNSQQLSFDYLRSIYVLLMTSLIFAVLYAAREVLIPITLSVLIAFVIAPLMFRLERIGLSRLWSVLTASMFIFVVLGIVTWISGQELWGLVEDIPEYKQNLIRRIEAVRPSKTSRLSKAIDTIGELETAIEENGTSGEGNVVRSESGTNSLTQAPANPGQLRSDEHRIDRQQENSVKQKAGPVDVRIVDTAQSAFEQLGSWVNPMLGPLGTAGLVIVLVVFILLDLDDLHDRLIRLTGESTLPRSNIAIDDAIGRVSRYIRMTFLINSFYGVVVGVGLWLIGIPNAILWGVLGATLRFVPYLGPMIVFLIPTALSLAATSGWMAPGMTVLLFAVLELTLNNVIEPWLYGRSTGVSSMGLIFASVFWAWIWGPVGLILATPITVILVVIGRHFPQLQLMTTLFAEKDTFQPHDELFQRLMLEDQDEAANIVSRFAQGRTLSEVCDQLYLPVLTLIESHRKSRRLTTSTAETMCQAVVEFSRTIETSDFAATSSLPVLRNSRPIVIVPERHTEDRCASEVVKHVLIQRGYDVLVSNSGMLTGELVEYLQNLDSEIVILSSLGGGRSALFMSISRRLKQQSKPVTLIAGLWDCPEIRNNVRDFLLGIGIPRHVSDSQGVIVELESALQTSPPAVSAGNLKE